MPRTIDDKIVEMRFDNRDFEKNTRQSMATLDKLKTSLDMSDAERNFNKISKASDGLSFREASDSVDTFSVKLSAMSSVAVAAVGRITNSLMDLGEQLVRNLSGIDYMGAGFSKYEDIIGYQQTMLNNAKNLSTDEMQVLLDKLVWFADETSFSADAMMQAMSSYISAGATEIEAQAAALGTALWAARTGNSNEALLRANYNLPQIFGKGYMQMQDWASIVNAKMDAPWVRDLFIETAAELGELEKKADGFYTTIGKKSVKVDASTFTGTFQGEWLTSKVLLKTFEKLTKFTDDVYDEVQETGELTFDVIKRLGDEVDDIGYKALKMAQETKTWSEAWGYIQGALSAGWSRTFEYIFGSYETAKEFFSDIVENLYTIFLEPGNSRNNLFKDWSEYTPIVAKNVTDTAKAVDDITTKLENAREIVLNIIRGNYGNGAARVQALAEQYGADAGRELQSIVNQVWKQWDGKKWSLNYDLLDQLTATKQVSSETSKALKEAAQAIEEVEEPLNGRDDFLDGLAALGEGIGNIFSEIYKWTDKGGAKIFNLTGEGLYEFTHKVAEAFRRFRDGSENFEGDFLFSWLYSLQKILLIIDNLTQPIRELFKSIGKGFVAALFPEGTDSAEKMGLSVLHFLTNIETLTAKLRLTEEQSEKLSRIFQGLFTPFKIIGKILSSISDAVTKVFDKTNNGLGGNTLVDKLLDIGEGIANIIIGFDEWLDKSGAIDKFVVPAVKFVSDALSTLWGWLKKILHLDTESKFPTFEDLFEGWQTAKSWIHEHVIAPFEEAFGIDLHFPTWDEVMEKWGKFKDWLNEHIKKPIKDAFGIDLHIPTWDEIAQGWKDAKAWIHKYIIEPFEEITGIDLHWPTWEEIKSKWNGFKDWVKNNIIAPIEQAFNIDVHWPTLEEVKGFFTKIWEFITGIFGPKGAADASSIEKKVDKQSETWSVIGNVFSTIIDVVKRLLESIGSLIDYLGQNESLDAVFKTGLFAVILEMFSRLIDSAYGFMNLNPIMLVNEVFDSISSLGYAAAEKKQSEAVKNLAISIAILAGSMFVLALLPIDRVRESLNAVLELVVVMGSIAIILNKMAKTGSSSFLADKGGIMFENTRSDLTAAGNALLQLAGAIAILAGSLALLSFIDDPAKLKSALFAIETLLLSVTGVMLVITNSSKKIGKDESVGQVTGTLLALSVLIFILASTVKKFSKIENFSTENEAFKAVKDLLLLITLLVGVVLKGTQSLQKDQKQAKATATLMATLVFLVGIIAVIAILARELSSPEVSNFKTIAEAVSWVMLGVAGILIAVAALTSVKGSKGSKTTDSAKFIKTAVGISLMIQALAVFILAIGGAIALIASTTKGMSDKEFDRLADTLGFISVLMVVLVGMVTIISSVIGGAYNGKASSKIISAMMAISLVLAAIGVAIVGISFGLKIMSESSGGVGAILASALAVIGVISALAGAVFVIILSTKLLDNKSTDSSKVFKSLIGISILMIAIGVAVSGIILSMAVLSNSKNGAKGILSSTLAIVGILSLLAIMVAGILAVTFSLSKYDVGNETFKKLLGLSILMVAIGAAVSGIVLSLSVLSNKDPDGITASMLAVVAILGAMTVMVAALVGLSKLNVNLNSVSVTILALSAGVAAIALAVAALTAVVGNKKLSGENGTEALKQAVLAIAALFGILTAVAIVASIPVITAGFAAVTSLLIGIGIAAAGFATGVALIVASLALLKNSIYDIGENGAKFEAGVDVVFSSLVKSFQKNLPIVLETLYEAAGYISKTIVAALLAIATNINTRIPEFIAQAMGSVLLALHSIKQWIGPLVAEIFEFVVDVIEGLAYAINTKGGKLIAAVFDVVASVISLVVKAIGEILSVIFPRHREQISKAISQVSSDIVSVVGNAGTAVVEAEDHAADLIIKKSPRLAEYYAKYGALTEEALESSGKGVEGAISGFGSGIADSMGNMFGGNSLEQAMSDGLSTSDLQGLGSDAGNMFSFGFTDGLGTIDIAGLFGGSTTEDFYNDGYDKGTAEQKGYVDALWEGIRSGRIKTVEDIKKWADLNGAAGQHEFIDQLIDLYDKGELKNLDQVNELWDQYQANGKHTNKMRSLLEEFTKAYGGYRNDIGVTRRSDDEAEIIGGYENADKAIIVLQTMLNLLGEVEDVNELDSVHSQLLDLADVLDSYTAYPEFHEAAEMVRDLLESPEFTKADTTKVVEALEKRAEAHNEYVENRAEADKKRRRDEFKSQRAELEFERAGLKADKEILAEQERIEDRAVAEQERKEKVYETTSALLSESFYTPYMDYYLDMYNRVKANSPTIAKMIDDMLMDESGWNEFFYKPLLASEYQGMYEALKKYWRTPESVVEERYETQPNALRAAFNRFLGLPPDTDAKQEMLNMITDLAEVVPEHLAKRKNLMDSRSVQILEQTDWAAIIANPESINEEQFVLLAKYLYMLGEDVATQYALGLAEGITKSTPKLEPSITTLGRSIVDRTEQILEIQSPSRVAKGIGENFVLGLAEGVEGTAEEAGLASEETALSMAQRLKDAISSAVGFSLEDLSPVIRPILDLDAIAAGASQINGLVGGNTVYGGFGVGSARYGDLQAIAQMNKTGLAQAIQESVLSQPVNQTLNNTFNIQSNDPNEVARKVSAILSNQIQRKNQVWSPTKAYNVAQ